MTQARHTSRRQRGQALVEFTFAVPVLLLFLVAIVYFGRAFYVSQILSYAAQEGARVAARTPNMSDPFVRDQVRGFTTSGGMTNPNSVIYSAMSGAQLLSSGINGDLPPSSAVKILPWDSDGSAEDFTPPGTVAVRLEYPYSLLINPFTGQSFSETTAVAVNVSGQDDAKPIPFPDFKMSEKATVSQEIYQQVAF